jgi:hypothetical protein
MKNKTPIIFSLNLLLMLFGTSCKERPCEEEPVKVDTIRVPETRLEPLESYTGFDTLKFLTDKGDTITFLGQGLNIGYKKLDIYAEDYCSTKRVEYMQFKGYTFYPTTPFLSDIQYYISPQLRSGSPFYLHIIINKCTFYRPASLPPLSNSAYINNFDVNGTLYHNVLKIEKDYFSNNSYVYYNKTDGLLQVIFPDGSTLTKIK